MNPSLLIQERRDRLHETMAREDIDLLAVAGDAWRCDYLRYATGVALLEGNAVAFIERDGGVHLIVESPAEATRFANEQPEIRISCVASASAEAERIIAASRNRKVALGPRPGLPYRLAKGEAGGSVAATTAMLDKLMLVKTPAELTAYRRASQLADEGYKVFLEGIKIGKPEYQLVAGVEAFYRANGCAENFQILGSGGVDMRGMHPPGDNKVKAGDLVTTELTPCIEGYYAQICRTAVVGEPTRTQQRVLDIYSEALEAGIAIVKPGIRACDIARAENDVFRKYGLGDYVTSAYTRVRGHGLGLYTDARPAILEDVEMVIEANMTLVVHPNTYNPEVGYFVLGDSIIVTETGCEVLTKTPRQLFCVSGH
jgi:Xaa-Pro dipeptidase